MKPPSFRAETILLPVRNRFSELSNLIWYLLAYLIVFAAGCKKVTEETGLSGVCPMVISTSPADTVTGVSINTTIEAIFNEVMDSSTINSGTFTLKHGDTVIAGVVAYTGTTATFSPSANLAPNTTYTGTITTGAKDPAHDALISNYVWTFTTFQFAAPPSFLVQGQPIRE
jgi:Big-like domain-containing protein